MQDFEHSKYCGLFVGLLACLFMLPGCGGGADAEDNGKPTVVATTTMIEDLAKVIGGDEVNVIGIMRTGEDPHLYDVKPKDATRVKTADLVLMNGLHLEATLDTIIKEKSAGKVVALAEQDGIEPITGGAGLEIAADPHCWMDPRFYGHYALATAESLGEIDPEHAEIYKERALAYTDELLKLDAWIRQRFDEVPEAQRVIVTGHDAFAYFGKAYGIQVHGLIGISTEQEPTPQDIEQLKTLIRSNGIRAVFPESSLGGSLLQLLDKVASDTGAVVGGTLHSDSLGEPGSDAGTYLGMMRHNTDTMVEALKGSE